MSSCVLVCFCLSNSVTALAANRESSLSSAERHTYTYMYKQLEHHKPQHNTPCNYMSPCRLHALVLHAQNGV